MAQNGKNGRGNETRRIDDRLLAVAGGILLIANLMMIFFLAVIRDVNKLEIGDDIHKSKLMIFVWGKVILKEILNGRTIDITDLTSLFDEGINFLWDIPILIMIGFFLGTVITAGILIPSVIDPMRLRESRYNSQTLKKIIRGITITGTVGNVIGIIGMIRLGTMLPKIREIYPDVKLTAGYYLIIACFMVSIVITIIRAVKPDELLFDVLTKLEEEESGKPKEKIPIVIEEESPTFTDKEVLAIKQVIKNRKSTRIQKIMKRTGLERKVIEYIVTVHLKMKVVGNLVLTKEEYILKMV